MAPFVGALGLVGCTGHADLPAVSAEPASLLELDLTYSRELVASAPTRLEAEAHFIRYRAADRNLDKSAVAGLLGLGGDDDMVTDTCRVDHGAGVSAGTSGSATGNAIAAAPGALEVALLDAGALTIRNGGVLEAVVEPQHYPELLPFVSGVVYGLEVAPSREVLPAARIEIEADGGEDVGPFVAQSTLPRAFPNLAAAKASGDGGLELAWSADASASPVSPISLELRWAGPRPGVVRCRATDDGRFTVPAALTDGLDAAIGAGASAQISAARSERAALDAPGAGHGQLVVMLRDVAPLVGGAQP